MIRVGTCAFTGHRGLYPPGLPAHRQLAYYATQFNVVEVDALFYRPLPARVAERWATEVPTDFRFDLKVPGSLTGHRPFDPAELRAFHDFVQPLAERQLLGAVLVQWPPWHRRSRAAEQRTAEALRRLEPLRAAVEFRHQSWYEDPDALAAWLTTLNAVHVVVDAPPAGPTAAPWLPKVTTPALSYARFHGRNALTWSQAGLRSSAERFRYRYSASELTERVPDLLALAAQTAELHVLMNNNYGSYAVDGARWFRDHLAPRAGTQVRFPDWD